MVYSQIVRKARHGPSSVKRYVETFGRVVVLWEKDVYEASDIAYIVGVSERLAREYLELRQPYDTPAYRDRLEEIARQVRRVLNGDGEEKGALGEKAARSLRECGARDFPSGIEHLLETEFKLVGSHRVIRLMAQAIMELHREFYPEARHLEPGTILWATTKAGDQSKVGWGKRTEDYGIQMVKLPLVTKAEIETRMLPGPGRDPRDNRRKEFRRDMGTAVRLIKSAAEQGGLL